MNGGNMFSGKRRAWLLAGAVAVAAVILLAPVAGSGTAMALTANEPLAGGSPVTAAQMEAELSFRNPGHIHPGIASLYAYWGPRYGIRSDLAFAQMLHETNSLRYGGIVQPWQNNFAGIGATGPGHPGNSYPTAEAGVKAHLQLLRNYVNLRGCRTLHDLNGRWAVPGAGYGEAIARYATEMRNFSPAGFWMGNFNEIPGTPASGLSAQLYFPWYDSLPAHGMGGNWILVGNQGPGTATVTISIGGTTMHDPASPANDYFTIPEGGQITPQFGGVMAGPVIVTCQTGQQLSASQRVLYRDSFSEVSGVPAGKLSDSYEFSWYDSLPQDGMAGNWVLIANAGSQPADVDVSIGGRLVASYAAAQGNPIPAGATVTATFAGVMAGPVHVSSANHQPLIASQRVLYKESFSEVTGYPTTSLDTNYYFSWYDSLRADGIFGDWILIANYGAAPATVNVFAGNTLIASYGGASGNAIPPGGVVTPTFAGLRGGPIHVSSLNGQPLLASQRVLFRDSFEEVQGSPPAALTSGQLFPWYDATPADQMSGDWILVANRGSGAANVQIYIGGVRMHDPVNPANDYFTVPEGGVITPVFSGRIGGPVRVVATTGQPLLTSQRVLYKYGPVLAGN
ncbi:MAG: glucosaminidase domain-containing protein [Thermoleophilia bacterium]